MYQNLIHTIFLPLAHPVQQFTHHPLLRKWKEIAVSMTTVPGRECGRDASFDGLVWVCVGTWKLRMKTDLTGMELCGKALITLQRAGEETKTLNMNKKRKGKAA